MKVYFIHLHLCDSIGIVTQQLALIRLHRHKLSPTGLVSHGLCCHLKCWHEDGSDERGAGAFSILPMKIS